MNAFPFWAYRDLNRGFNKTDPLRLASMKLESPLIEGGLTFLKQLWRNTISTVIPKHHNLIRRYDMLIRRNICSQGQERTLDKSLNERRIWPSGNEDYQGESQCSTCNSLSLKYALQSRNKQALLKTILLLCCPP